MIQSLLVALAMAGAFILGMAVSSPTDRMLHIAYQLGYRDGLVAGRHPEDMTETH